MADITQTKILMIEDDSIHRQMYSLAFKQAGFNNFLVAENGQQGLDKTKEEHPDLILLDLGLEDINGTDVLKELKKDSDTSDIPVIVLSNMREQDKGREVREFGAADYLLKAHYLPREVMEKVKKFLQENK